MTDESIHVGSCPHCFGLLQFIRCEKDGVSLRPLNPPRRSRLLALAEAQTPKRRPSLAPVAPPHEHRCANCGEIEAVHKYDAAHGLRRCRVGDSQYRVAPPKDEARPAGGQALIAWQDTEIAELTKSNEELLQDMNHATSLGDKYRAEIAHAWKCHEEVFDQLTKANIALSRLRAEIAERKEWRDGLDQLWDETTHLFQRACFVAGARWRETTLSVSGNNVIQSEAESRYPVRDGFSLATNYELRTELSRLRSENERLTVHCRQLNEERDGVLEALTPEHQPAWQYDTDLPAAISRLRAQVENLLTPEEATLLLKTEKATMWDSPLVAKLRRIIEGSRE